MELVKRLFREEEGQGMTEYVLIIALIALAAIAVMMVFGQSINGVFQRVSSTLDSVAP